MPPIAAANTFATLVGLICNWKAERGATATDKFQDFMVYLSNHNFQELRTEIIDSRLLQEELTTLLNKDFANVSAKLDMVCQGLSSLSDKIEALSPLVHTLKATTEDLSQQAMEVLKVFAQSGATRMISFRGGTFFGLLPTHGQFGPGEPRFIEDDLTMLISFGLLSLADHNGDGDPIYALTRLGVSIADGMPEVKDADGNLIGAPQT